MTSKRPLAPVAILVTAMMAIPAVAHADLVVTLEPSVQTFTAGDSGFLDVFVTGTSTTGDPVAGYTIAVNTTITEPGATGGLDYTNITEDTAAEEGYIFPDNDGIIVRSLTFSEVQYDDLATGTPPTPTNVAVGDEYGAGRIFFGAVTPGTYALTFDEAQSGFFDPDGDRFETTYTGATITVLPAAVPEPTTTLLLGLTGAAGFVVTRVRRNKKKPEETIAS